MAPGAEAAPGDDVFRGVIEMNWMNQIGDMLQQYANPTSGTAPSSTTQDFEQVAAAAPRNTLGESLSEAFRSDQTPPFANILSNLFGSSNGQQQAGLLNTLIAAVGPGVVTAALSRAGASQFGGGLLTGGQNQITPEQASQIPPEAVHEIAREAEKQDPSIVDRVGQFYAEHPTLVQTLGAGALAVVMGKMAKKL
jgi:hypothetical protein